MSRIVRNTPSPRLMQTIGATNLTSAEAIAELVANCFDAALPGVPARIVVKVEADEIRVIDYGIGMNDEVIEGATRLAEDMSHLKERSSGSKGHFGMGLKSACAALGNLWEIHTRPLDDNVEYSIIFDLNNYVSRAGREDAWDMEIVDTPWVIDGPLGEMTNGTAIIIKQLKNDKIMAGSVLAKLGETFKAHIDRGDEILVNGTPAIAKEYRLVPGTKTDFDLTCGPKDEYRIFGWVGLDIETHNSGDYGFNIYRHDQLIESWNKDWFSAHLMTSRIIGEAHIDFIDATFYKQGLQESEEWVIASRRMKEFLKAHVSASRDLSRKGNINKPVVANKIIGELREKLKLEPSSSITSGMSAEESASNYVPSEQPKINHESTKLRVGVDGLNLQDGTEVQIVLLQKEMSADSPLFDLIYEDFTVVPKIQVVVNSAHQLWVDSKDQNLINILATADAVFRTLINEFGMTSSSAFQIKNEWISKAAAKGVIR